jgi:hypothetical protein
MHNLLTTDKPKSNLCIKQKFYRISISWTSKRTLNNVASETESIYFFLEKESKAKDIKGV